MQHIQRPPSRENRGIGLGKLSPGSATQPAAGGLAGGGPVAAHGAGRKDESDPDTALCAPSKGDTVTRDPVANWFPGDADAAGPGSSPQTRARSALMPLGAYPCYGIICFPAAPAGRDSVQGREEGLEPVLGFESQPSPVSWQGAWGE